MEAYIEARQVGTRHVATIQGLGSGTGHREDRCGGVKGIPGGHVGCAVRLVWRDVCVAAAFAAGLRRM